MPKELKHIRFTVDGVKQPDSTWVIIGSCDLEVSLTEYPDWEVRRKGILVVFTPAEETQIKNFVANVVLPQAEAAK